MIVKDTSNVRKPERLCPFILDRNEFCYCVDINSEKIRPMTEYCIGNYEECPHYEGLSELRLLEQTDSRHTEKPAA